MHISGRKGRGCIKHNQRDIISKNVDSTRTRYNIVYKNETLEDAYEKLFGEAFRLYNASVRKDRRFDGTYLEKILQSKKTHKEKEYYEWVVQLGSREDCGYGIGDYKQAERALNAYMKSFQERNPHLYVFNAVLHRDEATPHIHIDYIPFAHYEKGQKVRTSLTKALEQQGFEKSKHRADTSTMAWQVAERERLREVAREFGFEVEEEQHSKAEHLSVETYKTVQTLDTLSTYELAEKLKKDKRLMHTLAKALEYIDEPRKLVEKYELVR